MKAKTFLLSLMAFALISCATPQSGPMVVDAGPMPTKEQAEQAIKNGLQMVLKDPDSLKQFRLRSGPKLISWYRGLVNGGGHEKAWLYCYEYNAKNSFGAYTGLKIDGAAMRVYGDRAQLVPFNIIITDARCN